MKTISIQLYKYDELSVEAQQRAIEALSDINVDFNWWAYLCDDAREIGLEITEFDLGGHTIDGKLISDVYRVIDRIKQDHRKTTETYQLALQYEEVLDNDNIEAYEDNCRHGWYSEEDFDYAEVSNLLKDEFLCDLLECYRTMLQREYDYLTSREAIEETIRANEYDFTENGEIY